MSMHFVNITNLSSAEIAQRVVKADVVARSVLVFYTHNFSFDVFCFLFAITII